VCVPVQFVRTYLHTAVVFCSGQEETKCEMGFVNNILMIMMHMNLKFFYAAKATGSSSPDIHIQKLSLCNSVVACAVARDVLSAVSMHVYDYNMPTTWIELGNLTNHMVRSV